MKHIMIIDDDLRLAELYKAGLKEEYKVTVAHQGREGWQQVQNTKPDLVVLDIMLGGDRNGFDILKQIKNNQETSHIPVIMISNLGDQEKTALDMGASAYVEKVNTDIQDLRQIIADSLITVK